MKHKAGRIMDEMGTSINLDIELSRLILVLFFAFAYPILRKTLAFSNGLADVAYYMLLFVICLSNRNAIGQFLRLPELKGKLPNFSGHRIDRAFTYPLFLTAGVIVLNSLLVMTGLIPRDVQNLSAVSLSLPQLIILCVGLVIPAVVEELFNFLMVVLAYKAIGLRSKAGLVISILAAALLFGLLHVFSWNISAAAAIGITFIPLFITTLYLRSIWVSVMAHFYNDLITMTGIYSPLCSKLVIAVIIIPCLAGMIKELAASKSKSSRV